MGLFASVLSPLLLAAMVPATDADPAQVNVTPVTEQVQPAAPVYYSTMVATVRVPCAALRADASTRQPVVDLLYQGSKTIVIQMDGEWLKVRAQDDAEVTGWLHRIQIEVGLEEIAVTPTQGAAVAVAASD